MILLAKTSKHSLNLYSGKMWKTLKHAMSDKRRNPASSLPAPVLPEKSFTQLATDLKKFMYQTEVNSQRLTIKGTDNWTEIKETAIGPMRERAVYTAARWQATIDMYGQAVKNDKGVDWEDLGVLTILGLASLQYRHKEVILVTSDEALAQTLIRVFEYTPEELTERVQEKVNVPGLGNNNIQTDYYKNIKKLTFEQQQLNYGLKRPTSWMRSKLNLKVSRSL